MMSYQFVWNMALVMSAAVSFGLFLWLLWPLWQLVHPLAALLFATSLGLNVATIVATIIPHPEARR